MKDDKTIQITVQSGRGSVNLEYPKQTKISQVIKDASSQLGYPGGGNYVLVRKLTNEVLEGSRPLISYQIENNEILILSEDGSGV